jgi:hypothetical protein
MTKRCSTCKVYKKLSNFHKDKSRVDGHETRCKQCRSINHRKKTYDISDEDFQSMLKHQDNKCAICKTTFSEGTANVDHSHSTGKVRELLCSACNMGIGYLKENETTLLSAIEYINKHNRSKE